MRQDEIDAIRERDREARGPFLDAGALLRSQADVERLLEIVEEQEHIIDSLEMQIEDDRNTPYWQGS